MPPEAVPARRYRPALAALLLQHLGWRDAVLRASYRLYADSWGMTAHTAEVSADVALGERWRFSLRDRAHLQSSVDFWERAYAVPDAQTIPRWRTLDRELSASWSESLGVGARFEAGPISAYVDVDGLYTRFLDSLLLEHRTALLAQVGLRWSL
jgi:hypothetical protein